MGGTTSGEAASSANKVTRRGDVVEAHGVNKRSQGLGLGLLDSSSLRFSDPQQVRRGGLGFNVLENPQEQEAQVARRVKRRLERLSCGGIGFRWPQNFSAESQNLLSTAINRWLSVALSNL